MAVIAGRNIRVTANRSWCGIAWTNPGGRIEGRTLPELAALFARASQAEQALATLRELIHTASGLDDHRYSAEQMVKEMAESWEAESAGREKAEQALATVTAERDEARALLADRHADLSRAQNVLAPEVGRALTAEEMAEEVVRLLARIREHEKRENALHSKGMQFRQERDALKARLAEAERERDAARGEASIHYAVIEQYRSRLAKTARVVEAARKMLVEHDTELQETENEARLARALRALDEDSGGSGAASNPGEAASAIGDNGPEPAGREPQAPVTRAEIEELKAQVEKYENLFQAMMGYAT